jgi:hypothetical protein
MAALTLIIGSITLLAAGFGTWYAVWHRRMESCFERVPVSSGRSVHVLRRGVDMERGRF